MPDPYDTSFRLAHRLRDIVLPDGVSWWPLAPGWWILAGFILSLALTAVWLIRARYALRREALRELAGLLARYKDDDDARGLLVGLSILLKRVAVARDGRSTVAALCGISWLGYLDRRNGKDAFFSGVGAVMATLPYMPREAADARIGHDEIRELTGWVRRWIRVNT